MAKENWIERQLKEAKLEFDTWETWKKEALMREVERGSTRIPTTGSQTPTSKTDETPQRRRKIA